MAICKNCGKKYFKLAAPVSARGVCRECFELELKNESQAEQAPASRDDSYIAPRMNMFALLILIPAAILTGFILKDVLSTQSVTKGQCLLARRVILPDVCVNSCTPSFDCTLTTRPYARFFTQAASCQDEVICE